MRIDANHTIALVIDYQEKLVPAMADKEQLVHNSCILLEGLQALGVPVVVTQQYTKGLGMTIPEIQAAAGTKEYIDKIAFTAYDSVESQIHEKKFVIVCGIEAHICVLQTVIDLREAGFVPVLVTDCISSRKPHDKEMGIQRAIQEGVVVTTYEAILFELLKVAGTETSKKIQKLIR